jgi:two-component system, cell cycle sensor histidine kinase and response regulator CckA
MDSAGLLPPERNEDTHLQTTNRSRPTGTPHPATTERRTKDRSAGGGQKLTGVMATPELSKRTSVGQVPMERLRTIFDGMFDGVWLIGSDSRTTYVNEAMAGLLGTTPDAMHGHPITEYLSEEFQATAEAMIGRQPVSVAERVDMRFLRADGADLWTLVAASPIVNADGSYVGSMLNVSDVTGKRAAQNQAMQNQKLEAIGAFAAGISHDFNNLLTSIRGYTELAHAELPEGEIRADLDQVIASADRAQAITGRLLAFTRGQALQPVVVDPGRVLLDMLPMLRSLLSEDIDVVLDVEPGKFWIRIDPVALDQILVNLAVNAEDAMHNGGTLTISMDEVEGRPQDALGGGEAQKPSVRIRIIDSGAGMDDTTLARLFDPFFTTKGIGKGTGLGLSTVYGLIGQSGGSIRVESAVAAGSTFTILLPKVAAHFERQPVPAAQPPDAGVGIVLMVEDEPSVREFARRVLDRAGHTLLTAGNGQEALHVAESWEGSIDVLLTDIVMPGMHGQVLAARLLKIRPDIRVIFMSGYAEDSIPALDRLVTPAAFLAKPFSSMTLAEAVSREITEARAALEQ